MSKQWLFLYSSVLLLADFTPAIATMGGYDRCSTADGRHSIDFAFGSGDLVEAETATETKFEQLSKTLLESKRSTCQSTSSSDEFEVVEERYMLRIRQLVRVPGRQSDLYLYCEKYWDNSVAGACDSGSNDIVKQHSIIVPSYKQMAEQSDDAGTTTSVWNHNGSLMYLVAEGRQRKFIYRRPKLAMLDAGAKQDTVLFNGEAIGDTFSGTAYIFNRKCGAFSYSVSGSILDSGRRVLMRGKAPKVNNNCKVSGSMNDELEFTLVNGQ